MTFTAFLNNVTKNANATFWGTIGILFIVTSGHTDYTINNNVGQIYLSAQKNIKIKTPN